MWSDSRWYDAVSWIPLTVWVAANVYVSQFEGWGAWAAAPILIFPLALSLIFGAYGLGVFIKLPGKARTSPRALITLVLPWIPIIHVVVSNLWRRLG